MRLKPNLPFKPQIASVPFQLADTQAEPSAEITVSLPAAG